MVRTEPEPFIKHKFSFFAREVLRTLVGRSPWAAASSSGDGKVAEKVAGNVFTAWIAAVIELILKNLVS
jgi:hypothetical protein